MTSDRKKHRRELRAFDNDIDLSIGIRSLNGRLERTFSILDGCEVGTSVESFRKAAGASRAIGFAHEVNWIDSSIFILALLSRFQEYGVCHLRRARRSTETAQPRLMRVVEDMTEGTHKSLAQSLGVEYSFVE